MTEREITYREAAEAAGLLSFRLSVDEYTGFPDITGERDTGSSCGGPISLKGEDSRRPVSPEELSVDFAPDIPFVDGERHKTVLPSEAGGGA